MNHHRKNKILISLLFILLITICENLYSHDSKILLKDKLAFGLSLEETAFPLLRLKLKTYKNFSTEVRIGGTIDAEKYGVGVFLGGLRGYYTLKQTDNKNIPYYTKLYLGGEFDYVGLNTYMGADFGSGYVAGIFVGAEKYVLRRTSVSLDFGPYYIYLKHKIFPISEESVDFILNFLINYYFM